MLDSYDSNEFDHLVQMGNTLAHQLNNQLTTILANTQLMILMTKDDDLMSYLKAVEDATREVGTLVRDFQESSQALTKPFMHKKS